MESIGTSGKNHTAAKTSGGPAAPPKPPAAPLRLGCRFLLLSVLARVPLHAAGGVDELLLAREERVAVGADLEPQLLTLRGPRGPGRPAGAMDVDDLVLGMDSWLHGAPKAAREGRYKHLILPDAFAPHNYAAGTQPPPAGPCPTLRNAHRARPARRRPPPE